MIIISFLSGVIVLCSKSPVFAKEDINLYGENEVSVFGSGYTCWYYTQFYGNYLFHSVLYNPGSMSSIQDGRLGINASHGCVRLSLSNAKWIYDNIPSSTKVVVY
ncbi:L,D-transpeptidase family protein [Mediterraneibacter catenae]|uniref:L,D-transpeptidase family protein n=1 Tax=Mediterraneibacter catenae TaxID=2594882 RepID=A0A5M9HVQ7_9FIRM|nr:L,D-transpeptidase family protein [Mediterraneibacter catenae]